MDARSRPVRRAVGEAAWAGAMGASLGARVTGSRVVVCFHEPHLGGATRSVERIVPLLGERGWEFSFWVPRPSELYDELAARGWDVDGAPRAIEYSIRAWRLPPGPAPAAARGPRVPAALPRLPARPPARARARQLDADAGGGAGRQPRGHPDAAPRPRDAPARPSRPAPAPSRLASASTRSSPSPSRAPSGSPGAGTGRGSSTRPRRCRPARRRSATGRSRSRSAPSPWSHRARAATSSWRPRPALLDRDRQRFRFEMVGAAHDAVERDWARERARPGARRRHPPHPADASVRAPRPVGRVRPPLPLRPVPDLDARGDGERPAGRWHPPRRDRRADRRRHRPADRARGPARARGRDRLVRRPARRDPAAMGTAARGRVDASFTLEHQAAALDDAYRATLANASERAE